MKNLGTHSNTNSNLGTNLKTTDFWHAQNIQNVHSYTNLRHLKYGSVFTTPQESTFIQGTNSNTNSNLGTNLNMTDLWHAQSLKNLHSSKTCHTWNMDLYVHSYKNLRHLKYGSVCTTPQESTFKHKFKSRYKSEHEWSLTRAEP